MDAVVSGLNGNTTLASAYFDNEGKLRNRLELTAVPLELLGILYTR